MTQPSPTALLAPEIKLLILSFLEYHDHPSRLLPLLTVSKAWARVVLTLLYSQPTMPIPHCSRFVKTLCLQDRQDGRIFWDSNHNDFESGHGQPLGIDYKALVKRPCRFIGDIAPTKQDLIHLWDLQAILKTIPALNPQDQPLLISTSLPYPPSPISTSSSPSTTGSISPAQSQSPPMSPLLGGMPSPLPSRVPSPTGSKSPSPSPSKVFVVRRKKRSPPAPGPTVMLLDLDHILSDTTQQVLLEVSGLKIQKLQYKWLLNTPLLKILEAHMSSLQELSLSRPLIRQDEFLAIADILDRARPTTRVPGRGGGGIRALKVDQCHAAGKTVLTALAKSCGVFLETLDIRQHITIRPMGNHALFPVDAPDNWDGPGASGADATSRMQLEKPLRPGRACARCHANEKPLTPLVDTTVESLEIGQEPTTQVPTQQNSTPGPAVDQSQPAFVETNEESRIDLALTQFGLCCPNLLRLRLKHITWLTDECLAGMSLSTSDSNTGSVERTRGLREIEILDSYYGSQVTVEGLLSLCSPHLEGLVVDRKSCWRTRVNHGTTNDSDGLCSTCVSQGHSSPENWTTGDRILFGLLNKGKPRWKEGDSTREHFKRIERLSLIEHWVTTVAVKEVFERWHSTLKCLNFRICKSTFQEIHDALTPRTTTCGSPIEKLVLMLPWADECSVEAEETIRSLFSHHFKLGTVQVNKRTYQRSQWG